jgi:hypothetical protein
MEDDRFCYKGISTMKKSAAKKSTKAVQTSASSSTRPLVKKQPQSKRQAAVQAGMFLYTDDAWSTAYFNKEDLHYVERVLFG